MATADDGPEGDVDHEEPPSDLEGLDYVGRATAEVLASAGVTVEDVREKAVSYRQLVAAGVNPGVAGKLRREHSLHWTLDEQGADLDRRSKRVRGLRDGEREWVAATAGSRDRRGAPARAEDEEREWVDAAGPDEPTASAEAAGGGDAFAAEAAWRERARSPSVASLPTVGRAEAERLEAVGVDTVRRLASADPDHLATRLGCSAERVREWVAAARERAD